METDTATDSRSQLRRYRWTGFARAAVVWSIWWLLAPVGMPLVLATEAEVPILGQAIADYDAALDNLDAQLRLEGFRRASRVFRQVIDESAVQNTGLYVNLGNAALQGEQLGQAIWAYRTALVLEPGHEQARQNLEHSRQLLPLWVPRPEMETLLDSFFFFHRRFSKRARSFGAAISFAIVAVLWTLSVGWGRTWARNTAMLPVVVWLALSGLSLWERWAGAVEDVVVTAPEAIARSADATGAPPRFAQPLPGGTEARVLSRRDGWARIRLADGRDAWMRASAVTVVGGK